MLVRPGYEKAQNGRDGQERVESSEMHFYGGGLWGFDEETGNWQSIRDINEGNL
jgi:hypothetical protein